MCVHCMDITTEELLEETGIHPISLDLIDSLVISTLALDQAGDVVGDPLKCYKRPLACYVAALEKALREVGVDPTSLLPKDIPVTFGPLPNVLS